MMQGDKMEKDVISKGLSESGLAGSSEFGVNDAGTCEKGDTRLTQVRSPDVHGYVYFVRAGETIKIGFSRNPPERLADLQTSNPEQLSLLGSFKGTRADERDLHERFCHLRLRGEWFRDDDELIEFIEDHKSEPRRPRASPETMTAIKKLIAKRAACGAHTPLGNRYSNLIEQIRNYEHADNREVLAANIAQTTAEIERLSLAA